MKCGSLILILSGAVSIVACGADGSAEAGVANAPAFEGIYQLTAASENTAGCAAPGASKLATLHDQFFVITGSEILGQKVAILISCASVVDCQSKRAAQLANQTYRSEYSYWLSSSVNATTLEGLQAGTGMGQGTQCVERTYAEHALTIAADHSVHLESRTKYLADKPQRDGLCWVDPAESKQEAASKECSSLEVIDGSFLQAN
jgi:hypothetical protein